MNIKHTAWEVLTDNMPMPEYEWKVRENKRAVRESRWFAWDVLVKPVGGKRGQVYLTIISWS